MSESETHPSLPKAPRTVSLGARMIRTPRQRHTNEGRVAAMSTTPTPVPGESTAGIELASATERVTAPEVEALGPQVEGEARDACGYYH